MAKISASLSTQDTHRPLGASLTKSVNCSNASIANDTCTLVNDFRCPHRDHFARTVAKACAVGSVP